MTKDHTHYCTKCKAYKDHECALYRNESSNSDTYDFRLCHTHEVQLWGAFLPEDATFDWQDEENDED